MRISNLTHAQLVRENNLADRYTFSHAKKTLNRNLSLEIKALEHAVIARLDAEPNDAADWTTIVKQMTEALTLAKDALKANS